MHYLHIHIFCTYSGVRVWLLGHFIAVWWFSFTRDLTIFNYGGL